MFIIREFNPGNAENQDQQEEACLVERFMEWLDDSSRTVRYLSQAGNEVVGG